MAAPTTKEKTKTYVFPFLDGIDSPKQDFYSINDKDYILKRGEAIDLPESVYDYIMEQEKAKLEAIKRARAIGLKEPKKG